MDRLSIITDDGGLIVHSDLFDEDERDIVARELLEQYPGGDLWTVPLPLGLLGPELVVMDVDSTFINEEVIEKLAAHAGREAEVRAVTERAMAGELDFAESLIHRVEQLKGVPASALDEVAASVTLTPGVEKLVANLHNAECHIALVSGGFTAIVEQIAGPLGIDDVTANGLEIVDGVLTGRVSGPIVDRQTKARRLLEIVEDEGLDIARTVAIGDGANDIDMIETAGFGIAFCAKPALVEHADAQLRTRRLDAVYPGLTGMSI